MLKEPRTVPKPEPVKLYCTACFHDRVVTTNGKCLTCGSRLLKPKHWDTTVKKFEIIAKSNGEHICLEIRSRLYLIPFSYLEEFKKLDRTNWEQVAGFIEGIKANCFAFKV